jgi:hypothetical protein
MIRVSLDLVLLAITTTSKCLGPYENRPGSECVQKAEKLRPRTKSVKRERVVCVASRILIPT